VNLGIWGDVAIAGAGVLAGGINTIVGSGSLITFPTLVALGFSPLVANVSNTIGLVPGSVSGAIGYRKELKGQRERALRLGIYSVAGGIIGAVLLLVVPGSFQAVVPWLVLLAVAMVLVQPRLSRWLVGRGKQRSENGGPLLWAGIFLTGVYGGYFGAAQGVLLIGMLGLSIEDHLQRLNGVKNVLAALVNGVAAVLFIIAAPVNWPAALILAGGSVVGGQLGARVGRRLPSSVLRAVIVVAGTAVAIKLLV
jgi:uncharacterized membrane protein YfcA